MITNKNPLDESIAKQVILKESEALIKLANNIPKDLVRLAEHIISFNGRVIVTGIGKSGYIARKIAASFASTGTISFFLHPAEASHGDLGMIAENDLVLILSNSGETKELFDIINYCKRFAIKIASITMETKSTLATNSDFLLLLPQLKEVSTIASPTTSTIMMLSLGDALTTAIHKIRGFTKEDFHLYHPGGKIGASLIKIRNIMRVGEQLPLVHEQTSFTETILIMNEKAVGCAIVVDDNLHLLGVITDGDLRRHIHEMAHTKFARDVMTTKPSYIFSNKLVGEALNIMNEKAITNMPVIENNIVVGVIHIHDLLRIGIN